MSADHYIYWVPGKIYNTNSKAGLYEMLSGGCVLLTMSVVILASSTK